MLKAAWQAYGLLLPESAQPGAALQSSHGHLHRSLAQHRLEACERQLLFYHFCAPAAVEAVLDGEQSCTPAMMQDSEANRACPSCSA